MQCVSPRCHPLARQSGGSHLSWAKSYLQETSKQCEFQSHANTKIPKFGIAWVDKNCRDLWKISTASFYPLSIKPSHEDWETFKIPTLEQVQVPGACSGIKIAKIQCAPMLQDMRNIFTSSYEPIIIRCISLTFNTSATIEGLVISAIDTIKKLNSIIEVLSSNMIQDATASRMHGEVEMVDAGCDKRLFACCW